MSGDENNRQTVGTYLGMVGFKTSRYQVTRFDVGKFLLGDQAPWSHGGCVLSSVWATRQSGLETAS